MARILLSLLVLLAALPAGAQGVALLDRIVAVVNKDVITLSELNETVATAERQLRRTGTRPPAREVLERQMLERLIIDKAQLQLARERGIRIDELQLDRAVQRVAESNKLTLADFRRALEADGVPFDAWREDLREQIMLSRLREREVDERIQVSDTEIDLFLEEMKNRPGEGIEYHLAHIVVRVPEQAAPDQIAAARAKAAKALAEARAGEDFARLAASYSDSQDALRGGVLGWRAHERLPELFSAALAKMNPGEVSEVLRSPAGFHLLKLLERRGAGAGSAPVAQTRLRHILIRASEAISEAEARRRLADLRERIVSGAAEFAELARVHSDDATGVPRRHRAGVRAGVPRAQGGRGEPAGAHALRLPPHPGAGTPLRGRLPGAAADAGAPGAARAQVRRGLPGVGAPAARPHLRRAQA
jgi:peptidyl-prolyl cis-trans isomerase SurA